MARLIDLLKRVNVEYISGDENCQISAVTFDSRRCGPGTLFVCIDGFSTDGHKYLKDAVALGTRACIVTRDVETPEGVTVVKVKDSRNAMAAVACELYDNPSRKMHLLGITGTKGKTTTAYIYWSILNSLGYTTGMIGTLGNYIANDKINTGRSTPTTPESCDLQYTFTYMMERGAQDAVMEVTSQALKLSRVAYTEYETGIFMNLTRDHITEREHPDMEDYFMSKAKLFNMCKQAVINVDSEYGQRLLPMVTVPVYKMSLTEGDIYPTNVETEALGMSFDINTPWGIAKISTNLQGMFNVYNIMAAVSACCLRGIDLETAAKAVGRVCVPGRLEEVTIDAPFKVLIDYAHTPDSLENVLRALKDVTKGRVICLFGCGGDRDHGKRPQMGKISCSLADISIITSDNPRTEDPDAIIDMIEEGAKETSGKYVRITDRKAAIKYALRVAMAGDVVVLAGKGQETYQMFGDRTIPFDERVITKQAWEEISNEG